MRLSGVKGLVRKDVLDTFRDPSFLVFLALAAVVGFFGRMQTQTVAEVVHTGIDTVVLSELRQAVGGDLELRFVPVADAAEARERIVEREADVALVAGPGLEAALADGRRPEITVISREFREMRDLRGQMVVGAVELALRRLAGEAPADLRFDVVEPPAGAAVARLHRELGAGFMIVPFMVMLGIFAGLNSVASNVFEEIDKKTMDALLLAASTKEVLTAKAIYGLVVALAGIPILLVSSGRIPQDPLLFAAGIVPLAAFGVGVGLFVGLSVRRSSQVSILGQLISWPLIAAAFAVAFPIGARIEALLSALPSSQAARIMANGMTGSDIFPATGLSLAVLGAWLTVAYVLLGWRLSRREG